MSKFLRPGVTPEFMATVGGGAAALPWYLAGGIPAANCVAAYQPIGAASLAASYVNLVSPGTNDIVVGVAPTWATETGWTFNGLTQRLNCPIKPSANSSLLIRYTTTDTIGSGASSVGKGAFGFFKATGKVYYERGGETLSSTIPASGILSITPGKGWINATQDKTIAAGSGLPDETLDIGAMLWNTVHNYFAAFDCLAWAYYDIDISAYLSNLVARVAVLPL